MPSYRQLKTKLLKDQEVKKSYDNLGPEYLLIVVSDKDIKNAKQFKATEIIIPPAPNSANNTIGQTVK